MKLRRALIASAVASAAVGMLPAQALADNHGGEVKIGIVTFLSGAAASPFGVPARNAAELLIQSFNAGQAPAPYATKGFGGMKITPVIIDEAGSGTNTVTEYRNLVQREKVDLVVGYVSSGNCLAVAPVADELKTVTYLFDCGTPRIFEETPKQYVFRSTNHAAADNVGAALYLKQLGLKVKSFSAINQNYAWGQDSWADFERSMKVYYPKAEVGTSQMPKLFAGQYSAEISALLRSKADVVHSSLWGGDLEAFILQAVPRGLFKRSTVVLTAGEPAMFRMADKIPDGTIIGARGPFGQLAPDNELNRWFRQAYTDRYNTPPTYPSYHMANGIMAAKAAYERAMKANGGKKPTSDQLAAATRGMTFEGPGGSAKFALSGGQQAVG
ncbi:MAG: ABC transporter substrate-binding protein, partial [Burkholderiaceae bacterium]